ncbi:electron transfer flavoprotein alpha subunit apoprotein [Marinactinospora thermotolerans DSM 45154]|uniref:Electron transfer flavoprotein alpha subunit apoprotein n=1 Tax=Marinactinospora thermotolerans DSM 45154 TaxID=1122192 RepID=A0A1T4RQS6_9ACTN|nr:electron transfer flavoprotein alpha subunit apoprotein [Marinactinospora thermotolerans DSM 45154]
MGREQSWEEREPSGTIAVVPVREGRLPEGGLEVIAEAGGAVLAGDGARAAASALDGAAHPLLVWETEGFRPAAWSHALAETCSGFGVVLLPACPDGRDLAPRLAARLGRPLLAGAVEIGPGFAVLPRDGDRRGIRVGLTGPAVVTLRPGTGGALPRADSDTAPAPVGGLAAGDEHADVLDAETLAVVAPDPTAVDLWEARRVIAGGAGLMSGPDRGVAAFALLSEVAAALGASVGATRPVTDAGLLPLDRRIGSSGARVSPDLYVALGVSGAPQHLSGTDHPAHVVAVNLDPGCPMMAVADLGLVTDAAALLEVLARRLGVGTGVDRVGGDEEELG